jgi:putative transposase
MAHDGVVAHQARFRFRVYPAAAQRETPARGFGCHRMVFNDVIALCEARFRNGEPPLSNKIVKQQTPRP